MFQLMPRRFLISIIVASVMLAVLCLLSLAPVVATDGPDVIIESITLDPLIPAPGQQFSITIVTRNQGNLSTGGSSFLNYVYLDPIDRPPTSTTTQTYRYGVPAAGGRRQLSSSRAATIRNWSLPQRAAIT